MANFKNTKKELTSVKNKSKLSIKKLKDILSFDLTDISSQIKQKEDKKNKAVNTDKSVKIIQKVNQEEKSQNLKTNSKPIIAQHRAESHKRHIGTDTSVSYFSPLQQIITTIPKVEPQQAILVSGVKKQQARKAPASASTVLPSKPPQPRSIEEDRDIKAKHEVGEVTTSYFPPQQQIITTIPKVEPQHAILVSDVKKQQAQKILPDSKEEFNKLDEMLSNFSKGEGEFKSANTDKNKPQLGAKISEVKKLIASFEQEAKVSKPQLIDKKLYEKMYESLAPEEKAQTTKSMFLQNARQHMIDKIVRSMQNGKSQGNEGIHPSKSPSTTLNNANKSANKGVTM